MPMDSSRHNRQYQKAMEFRERQSSQLRFSRKNRAPLSKQQNNAAKGLALVTAAASLASAAAIDPYGSWTYCGQPLHGVGAYCATVSSTEFITPPETVPSPELDGPSPYSVFTQYAQSATGSNCIMVSYPANSTGNCSGAEAGPYYYGQYAGGPPNNIWGFNVSASFSACQDAQGRLPNSNTSSATCFWQAQQNATAAVNGLYPPQPAPADGGSNNEPKIVLGVIGGVTAAAVIAIAVQQWRKRRATQASQGGYVEAPGEQPPV